MTSKNLESNSPTEILFDLKHRIMERENEISTEDGNQVLQTILTGIDDSLEAIEEDGAHAIAKACDETRTTIKRLFQDSLHSVLKLSIRPDVLALQDIDNELIQETHKNPQLGMAVQSTAFQLKLSTDTICRLILIARRWNIAAPKPVLRQTTDS